MEIRGKRILVLGGWGQVGSSICREALEEGPAQIVVCSLEKWQTEDALKQLRLEFPESSTDLAGEWGDVFARYDSKDASRRDLMTDPESRRILVDDLICELKTDLVHATFLYRVIERHRPHIIIDCINLATVFAYRDVYSSTRQLLRALDGADEGEPLKGLVEAHLANAYIPQLIRHVQVLYNSMLECNTRCYVKIGTSGTGGMGLNVPYTHSEEKPSRVLLAKSAIAGAHSLLLFLMARTPESPIIKEIKPTAAIAWKKIAYGPVERGGKPVSLFPLEMSDAISLEGKFQLPPSKALSKKLESLEPGTLESVYIDTGENGVFSLGEFEAITSMGQMEYVTPEEIALNVIFEIKGGNTGKDVIAALDQACMGPTFRAGALRDSALASMRKLEQEHEVDSVAFENLGPPKLSKILFESYLLKRTYGTMQAVAQASPEELQDRVCQELESDSDLRSRIISIGIPILLSDGTRLLRATQVKVPHPDAELGVSPERIDLWAHDGWIDLRLSNFELWRSRFQQIIDETEAIPFNDTSSRYERNREYWFQEPTIQPGKVASWLFINEEKGLRMKH